MRREELWVSLKIMIAKMVKCYMFKDQTYIIYKRYFTSPNILYTPFKGKEMVIDDNNKPQ